jgi:tripartite-type tricarboxylate transporter receptor subunit TctC
MTTVDDNNVTHGGAMRQFAAPHTIVAHGVTALLLAALCGVAAAQSYPTKPVRIVVANPPGGGFDFIGRLAAEKLGAELGQTFVVENRPGAGSLVGTQAVVQSPPDGYTLLVGGLANMAFNSGLYAKPGYDPVVDFAPIAIVGSFSYTLVARPDLPQSTLKDLIDFARANPGKLSIANAGIGTGQHVAGALLAQLAKIDLLTVSYKGAQAAYTDLLAGRVDLFFDNTTTARPMIEGKRVKAIATSGANRDAILPNVPTGRESGVDGLVLESWIGLFAPAKTPPRVIEQLRAALEKAMQSPDMRTRLQSNGWTILSLSPQETAALVRADAEKWPRFLRQAGIKAE